MNGIEITDVIIAHRNGATLVKQRMDKIRKGEVDIHFLTGYFTAMLSTLNIFQREGYFRRVGKVIELWVNEEACCCIVISEFYTIIAFVRLTERTKELCAYMISKVTQIQQRFELKYMKVLLGWNQNLQVFNGFGEEIKAIIQANNNK